MTKMQDLLSWREFTARDHGLVSILRSLSGFNVQDWYMDQQHQYTCELVRNIESYAHYKSTELKPHFSGPGI